jgi:hypothetical protein
MRFVRLRPLPACLIGIALICAPAAAACADCCPRADAPPAVAAAQACCGDCAPTIDRAPDPAFAALTAASIGLDATAALIASVPLTESRPTSRSLPVGVSSPASSARALPTPLRL